MKINLIENNYFFDMTIEPETLDEAALLLRLAAQTKSEPVKLLTDFSSRKIILMTTFNRKKINRLEFITNQTKD